MTLKQILLLFQNYPIESLLILSIIVSIPFFIYYFLKKIKPVQQLYKVYKKPKNFDYNLISIGNEGTGFVTDFIKNNPKSKIIIIKDTQSSRLQSHLTPKDVASANIDFLTGIPKMVSPYEVALNGKIISSEYILLATGAKSYVPDFIDLDKIPHFTPETLWNLHEVPKRLLIVGSNQTACELAQTFLERGSEVILADSKNTLLSDEEKHVSDYVHKNLEEQGVQILLNAKLENFEKTENQAIAIFDKDKTDLLIEFDVVIFSMTEIPNTEHIGLEKLDIELNLDGSIKVNSKLQTNYPTIYACGKVASYVD